ncbi:MAG: hypothetical protein WAL85_10390 [Candidatus Korobacteraceae bacterium]
MSEKKLGPLRILAFEIAAMVFLLSATWGQAATPPPAHSTSSASKVMQEQTPKPRPPTRKDVAELKAAMNWPGSVLDFVAIVGNYAKAGGSHGHIGDSMLAVYTSGKWQYVIDDGGDFSPMEMVDAVPDMPVPVALAIQKQALQGQVYWLGKVQQAELDKKVQAYGTYESQGDDAVHDGNFDAAIAAWTEAASVDLGDLKICGDLGQRVEIRAAKDAKARMELLHLSKEQAASWYYEHSVELWKSNHCDTP